MSNVTKDDMQAALTNIQSGLTAAELAEIQDAGDEALDTTSGIGNLDGEKPPQMGEGKKDDAAPAPAPAPAAPAAPPAPAAAPADAPAPAPAVTLEPEPDDTPALSVPPITIKPEEVEAATLAIAKAKADMAQADADRAAARKQVEDGELSAAEFAQKLDEINDARDAARDVLNKSERLIERHTDQIETRNQAAERDWNASFSNFVREEKNSIYSTNDRMDGIFRAAVGEVGRELIASKQDWTARQILMEADKRVRRDMPQMFGTASAPPAAPPAPAAAPAVKHTDPDRTKTPAVLPSIAALPNADAANVQSKFAHLDALTGLEYERALARLTPHEQDEYARL